MDRVYRVEVCSREGQRPELGGSERVTDGYVDDIAALGIEGVRRVVRSELYFLRGVLTDSQIAQLCAELLVDPIVQQASFGQLPLAIEAPAGATAIEVGLLHGVTDTVADNLLAHAHLIGVTGLRAASTGQRYVLYGHLDEDQAHLIARRLLCNDVIQYYHIGQLTPHVGVEPPAVEARAERIALSGKSDEELLALSRERLLSLDLAEMRAIQGYFEAEGREPTDIELESLAQTWSEHCGHKTFKGLIDYEEIGPEGARRERIDSLIRTHLQAATKAVAAPWVRSAFVDNAGIVAFTPDYEVSFKVETHNHPSALEPFGGANTGVGGVIRDIMGVSARPIANTDILCFGLLDTPMADLPGGVLHPRRIYAGVVAGIEDYGNKMGIPTVNGTIIFEPGYLANPLVYCGCLGIAPVGSHPRGARPGDLVVVLGGRTGRDGLHGATFSSIELTDETGETSGGAVQIGNPITEKMVLDAMLVARDEGLYTAITDCGAGGLSSAVSEMGQEIGAEVQLERVPLKYHGLQPWEIWLSEAQERMVMAVPPEHEARLREICAGYSVEMVVIGRFVADGRLHVHYEHQTVADLQMAFLHGGTPRRHLQARWQRPSYPEPAEAPAPSGQALAEALLAILAHPNVRSKENVVRRYDHEVQGGTVVKPFVGPCNDGPSDATVLKPLEVHDSWQGIAIGCGFNPAYGAIDPYAMAVCAIDEAVRNVVCVGADPGRISILDNFCWGNPLLPDRMGGLVRACKGCYDGALHYGVPFISGKDSLNNEYTDSLTGQQVAIPPSLLISAMGIVPDVREACSMDLKVASDYLYLLGVTRQELGGSYYYRAAGLVGNSVPGAAQAGPATAQALHRAIVAGLVRACHDCSEGGVAVAVAEMALSGRMGACVALNALPRDEQVEPKDDWLLFSESNGRYVVEVAPEKAQAFEALMRDIPHSRVGQVSAEKTLTFGSARASAEPNDREVLFSLPLAAIESAWRGHLADEGESIS
ncbi:MAG: phosphoribosylformylglycinamidine synthase subunit PurL [Anaerolineae bacterium]|nr:phosphoribosylformylglycinamidine synthase subunit PurL [Anaerolineae bacterium]